jgi:hypothetical protein
MSTEQNGKASWFEINRKYTNELTPNVREWYELHKERFPRFCDLSAVFHWAARCASTLGLLQDHLKSCPHRHVVSRVNNTSLRSFCRIWLGR